MKHRSRFEFYILAAAAILLTCQNAVAFIEDDEGFYDNDLTLSRYERSPQASTEINNLDNSFQPDDRSKIYGKAMMKSMEGCPTLWPIPARQTATYRVCGKCKDCDYEMEGPPKCLPCVTTCPPKCCKPGVHEDALPNQGLQNIKNRRKRHADRSRGYLLLLYKNHPKFVSRMNKK